VLVLVLVLVLSRAAAFGRGATAVRALWSAPAAVVCTGRCGLHRPQSVSRLPLALPDFPKILVKRRRDNNVF
jgi:hypothetical protein